MKTYKDSESIERDLKILDLERQIAWEEVKSLKQEYKDSLKPIHWIQSGIKLFGKYTKFKLLKRFMN